LLKRNGITPISIQACDTITQATEIDASEVDRLLAKGATGYVINLVQAEKEITDSVPPEITVIIQQFADVFDTPQGLPPQRACDHQIPLQPDAVPPNTRPYRVPHKHKEELKKQIQELLKAKVIRPSTSPFASPIILVKKKDHSGRLCVDYRKLNALTVKNKFPIPIIEDLLDELHGAKLFTKLDLRSGYHQIRMHVDDISKTAFRTYSGHYEYLVMPFGLSNAPGTFQSLMNQIFAPYLRKFILVFFDDILIYSPTLSAHASHVATALKVLQDNKLSVKLSKCSFASSQVEYLGHVISGAGVSTDPSKIAAIKDWITPTNVTQLRGFLGLCGYYR
jgi:hypothetical protein